MQYLAVLFYLAVWLVIFGTVCEIFRLVVYHIGKWRCECADRNLHQRRRLPPGRE